MNRYCTLLFLSVCLTTTSAQEQKEVTLDEVKVEAASIINKPDGMIIAPSDVQKQSSTNGYNLLSKLSLPRIRIDETTHSIIQAGGQGIVQVRVNGAIASKADLMSINTKLIKSVHFIDKPGVRYGDGIDCVINIITVREDMGFTLGGELNSYVTVINGDNSLYAKYNHKNSELSLTYDFAYRDYRDRNITERADYLLTDGSHHFITRHNNDNCSRNFGNDIQLKYSLADSSRYVFQATFSTSFSHTPGNFQRTLVEDGDSTYRSFAEQRSKSFSPVLDLYYHQEIGFHQSLTANVVATSIASDNNDYDDEGSSYAYHVDGRTWSLVTEAVYENRLSPFTLSFGARSQLKYTKNEYSQDVESTNNIHNSNLYLFGEVKGNIGKLSYMAGLGVTNERYRQGTYRFNHWLTRPKATFSYKMTDRLTLRYGFEMFQRLSRIAMVSDTKIRQNSMEWTVGNPDLRPCRVYEHDLRLIYTRQRLQTQIIAYFRQNRHPNLAFYTRSDDNQFYYMQKNQPGCDLFSIDSYTSWTAIPNKLSASFQGGIYRFFNRGELYRHYHTSFNFSGDVHAYLGRWTLAGYIDNGWSFMEGESRSKNILTTTLVCQYRFGNYSLSLQWMNPFNRHPLMENNELVNENIKKHFINRGSCYGNRIMIGFSWNLSQGRKYRHIEKTIHNKDTQTGIL